MCTRVFNKLRLPKTLVRLAEILSLFIVILGTDPTLARGQETIGLAVQQPRNSFNPKRIDLNRLDYKNGLVLSTIASYEFEDRWAQNFDLSLRPPLMLSDGTILVLYVTRTATGQAQMMLRMGPNITPYSVTLSNNTTALAYGGLLFENSSQTILAYWTTHDTYTTTLGVDRISIDSGTRQTLASMRHPNYLSNCDLNGQRSKLLCYWRTNSNAGPNDATSLDLATGVVTTVADGLYADNFFLKDRQLPATYAVDGPLIGFPLYGISIVDPFYQEMFRSQQSSYFSIFQFSFANNGRIFGDLYENSATGPARKMVVHDLLTGTKTTYSPWADYDCGSGFRCGEAYLP